ncbi:ATP-binding protein [Kitasatospora sp. NPDC058063]|uniref:ATP-binding protein n=1 Tax=unclassified Kitasatospora TaxID=2633591 RepID=UPI0036DF8E0E
MPMVEVACEAHSKEFRLLRRRVVDSVVRAGVSLPAEAQEELHLMLAELLSNAQRYGCAPDIPKQTVAVGAEIRNGTLLRVAITDPGRGRPDPTRAEPDESGRGLTIVAALASSYGVTIHEDGRQTVWFELPVGNSHVARAKSMRLTVLDVTDVFGHPGVGLTTSALKARHKVEGSRPHPTSGRFPATDESPTTPRSLPC